MFSLKKLLFCIFTFFSCLILSAQHKSFIEKTGWLIYWHDKIIWVEEKIDKCVNDTCFFQAAKEYTNGLNVKSSPSANWYGSIANGYAISYYHNDSIVNETDPKFLDSIWILPVKAKYQMGFEGSLENMTLSFIKDRKEIFIIYKGLADYDISSIELLRKKDKRRLKRVKNYMVYPPH